MQPRTPFVLGHNGTLCWLMVNPMSTRTLSSFFTECFPVDQPLTSTNADRSFSIEILLILSGLMFDIKVSFHIMYVILHVKICKAEEQEKVFSYYFWFLLSTG